MMRNQIFAGVIAAAAAGLLSVTAMAAGPRASSDGYIPNASMPAPSSQIAAYPMGPRASSGDGVQNTAVAAPVSSYSAATMGPRASSEHNIPSR